MHKRQNYKLKIDKTPCDVLELDQLIHSEIYPGIFSGLTYGYLTVISRSEPKMYGTQYKAMIECECSCGNVLEVQAQKLKNGHTKSCGCRKFSIENRVEHIHYSRASSILNRCNNPNSKEYHNYGGRGIKCSLGSTTYEVCQSLSKVPGFRRGLHINREDNNGDYTLYHPIYKNKTWINKDGIMTKGNLNWVTNRYNSMNRRVNISDHSLMTKPRRRWEFKEFCRIRNIEMNTYTEHRLGRNQFLYYKK